MPPSQCVLATAAFLVPVLQGVGGDCSPVFAQVFKALEIELLVRVFEPFRHHVRHLCPAGQGLALATQLEGEEWSRPLGRFLEGGRPPALAQTMTYLASLRGVAADLHDNGLGVLLYRVARAPR